MSLSFVSSSQLSNISFGFPLAFSLAVNLPTLFSPKNHVATQCLNHLFCLFRSVSMSSLLVRPPGTIVREGLMFYCSFLFIATSPRNFATRLEPKIWGLSPHLFFFFGGGAKNMLNFERFRTPFHFKREYHRNG